MEARAIAKNVKIAPRKARLVIDLIRGKNVIEADKILKNINKESARISRKVLVSAVANAENNIKKFPRDRGNFYYSYFTLSGLRLRYSRAFCRIF